MANTGRRILLDIGAHHGESLTYALDPLCSFDLVFSFEPSPACWGALSRFRDPRLRIQRFGLARDTKTVPLYGSGNVGASLFSEKEGQGRTYDLVQVHSVEGWFKNNTVASDDVWVKINCEGSELEIVEQLVQPSIAPRISHVILTPDLLKVPSLAHEHERLLELLQGAPFRFTIRDERHTSRQFIEWLRSARTSNFSFAHVVFLLGRHQPKFFVWRQRFAELGPSKLTVLCFGLFGRTAWKERFRKALS